MLAGAIQLALVRGKLTSRWWVMSLSVALLVSGFAFLLHEQNPWLFSRAAFLHHAIGWTLVVAALFPLGQALRPRQPVWRAGFAMTWVVLAVLLFCDRDVAPIFGHLSELAGGPARREDLAARASAVLALALPRVRVRARDAEGGDAADPVAGRGAAPHESSLRFDQSVTITEQRDPRSSAPTGARLRRGVSSARNRVVTAPVHGPAARRGVHGPVAGDLVGRSHRLGVFTFGVGVEPPPPTEAYGATGPTWTDDAARWGYFVALSLLLGIARLPAARAARAVAGAALEPPPRPRRRGRHRRAQRRYRGVRDAGLRRPAAAVRRPALRRPLADRDEDRGSASPSSR